ncbi:GPO family capsid scaffolding protein [Halomonas citrativorans]|uniref:GPO family capsid scaffolding protein n=1 Tax=Halomonas citrativorans TaxID=2742612 RepID=A0ABR9FDQ3_9GAMM|nr:GPO family capsid scaffolding protein [Halomonas citrativorans]MBE0404603.1 GPO family capsid scaffolding protein [Halomonas citrativorans]
MSWHRIAKEGATTDGRTISAEWLTQMAANFDPDNYGCRVNMEHIKGMLPDGPFKAYGDVTALKTEKDDDGKLGLYAEIDPTDELKAMVEKRQKIYTSMEVDLDFADTGEAYLVGLAVTDTPASLGTSMLQFSAQQVKNGDESPLASRKQRLENLFSAAVETDLSFSEEPEDKGPTLAERVKALFKKQDAKTEAGFAAFRADLEETLGLFVEKHQALSEALKKRPTQAAFNELKSAHDTLKKEFDALYSKLDNTPNRQPRTPATGNDGTIETDC